MARYKRVGNFDKRAKMAERKATHEKAKKQFERAKDWGKVAKGIDEVMHPFRELKKAREKAKTEGRV